MLILGHRGAAAVMPENTLVSFRAAWQAGADGVELDVHLTADGIPVVFHDHDGARLAGRPQSIAATSWAELQTWRVRGEPVPSLAEVLDSAPDGSRVLVEVKAGREALVPLASVLRTPRPVHLGLLGFDPMVMAEAVSVLPGIPVSLNVEAGEVNRLDALLALAVRSRWEGLSFGWSAVLDASVVRAVHGAGLLCTVWTVNDPIVAASLRAAGVDRCITDDPARLREFLDRGH
ncbi:MAG TPA: glycerophosphodiester phosphodiesterase family protein [Kiritimatiellia bacterium]|nr:glycerophosphodiester phosphodiesterase family protein [Kiritimatiellia bacterium]HMP34617.1 glycerophosphodiester phosphodiesterase family protein [Kiritimatiellia bacterium]